MALFAYPIDRPVEIPHFTHVMIFLGIIYIITITLVNVVAVGYDTITYSSLDYNGTHNLWYDSLVPSRGPAYNHRYCDMAILKLNDYVSTNSVFNFFLYQLVNYIDPSNVGIFSAIDGINYTNNAFLDCSVSNLQLTEYLEPVPSELKAPAVIACNTTSSKYLYLQTSTDEGWDALAIQFSAYLTSLENLPGPRGIQDAVTLWGVIARKLWYSFSTNTNAGTINSLGDRPSLLRQSIVDSSPLSYIRFEYTDTYGGGTPANGTWTMFVSYLNLSSVQDVIYQIVYQPTGQVDLNQTLARDLLGASQVLAPTIQNIKNIAASRNITNIDFWQLMNWMFVSHYWMLLLDFGQVSPSTFDYDAAGNFISYGPITYPTTYNIFVNETLFEIYTSYLQNTILPLFGYHLPEFDALNSTNHMNESEVSLKLLYTCTDLQLKSSEGLVISIIVADWALITALYAIALFIGGWWMQRKDYGKQTLKFKIDDQETFVTVA